MAISAEKNAAPSTSSTISPPPSSSKRSSMAPQDENLMQSENEQPLKPPRQKKNSQPSQTPIEIETTIDNVDEESGNQVSFMVRNKIKLFRVLSKKKMQQLTAKVCVFLYTINISIAIKNISNTSQFDDDQLSYHPHTLSFLLAYNKKK